MGTIIPSVKKINVADDNVAGMKKYEFKGKQFHEECFCCKVCRQPIGVKTFIPRDQEAVCVPCYEEQYAQRCVKCNGVRVVAFVMSDSSLCPAQIWYVLTRDHTVLPATHTFIHKWNEPYLPLLPSRRAAPHFGWYSFPVPLSVGG